MLNIKQSKKYLTTSVWHIKSRNYEIKKKDEIIFNSSKVQMVVLIAKSLQEEKGIQEFKKQKEEVLKIFRENRENLLQDRQTKLKVFGERFLNRMLCVDKVVYYNLNKQELKNLEKQKVTVKFELLGKSINITKKHNPIN